MSKVTDSQAIHQYTEFKGESDGCGARISLSYDSADESGLRITKEASGRDTLSSLARGGCGCEVWTAAALLFSWNEIPSDHVQRTELCMNGRSGTVRQGTLMTSVGHCISLS